MLAIDSFRLGFHISLQVLVVAKKQSDRILSRRLLDFMMYDLKRAELLATKFRSADVSDPPSHGE